MTSMLQPLDVSVNKPFKVLLRRTWNEWMMSGQHTYTPAGNMRCPEMALMCQWIVDAWQAIDPAIIIKSFLKCCISNAMDGTQDDIVWDDSDDIPLAQLLSATQEDDDADILYHDTDSQDVISLERIMTIFQDSDEESSFSGFEAPAQ